MSLWNRSGLLEGRGSPKSSPQEYNIRAGGMNGFRNLGLAAPLSGLVAPHLTDFSINLDARPPDHPVTICEELIEGTGMLDISFDVGWRRRNRLHLAITTDPQAAIWSHYFEGENTTARNFSEGEYFGLSSGTAAILDIEMPLIGMRSQRNLRDQSATRLRSEPSAAGLKFANGDLGCVVASQPPQLRRHK